MSVNLAPFPNGWVTDNPYGVQLPTGNIFLETNPNNMYNGKTTFRIDSASDSSGSAGGDIWIPVHPRDHVKMSCMIKTSGQQTDFHGGRIGLDVGGDGGRGFRDVGGAASVYELNNRFTDVAYKNDGSSGSAQAESELEANFVPFGTPNWVLKTWEFDVPDTVIVQPLYQNLYPTGLEIPVVSLGFWFDMLPYFGASGSAWFSDMQIYISGYVNPVVVPTDNTVTFHVIDTNGSSVAGAIVTVTPFNGAIQTLITDSAGNAKAVLPINITFNAVATNQGNSSMNYGGTVSGDMDVNLIISVSSNQQSGSQMWVATALGYDSETIDKLREIGHLMLPQNLIDSYHNNGEVWAKFVSSDSELQAFLKEIIDKLLTALDALKIG